MIQEETGREGADDPGSAYVSAADLRREFGLTDSHLDRLGPPDRGTARPGASIAESHRLYARDRVERWMVDTRDLLQESEVRRKARDSRREQARLEAEARRLDVHQQIAAAVRNADRRSLPSRGSVLELFEGSSSSAPNADSDEVTELAILNCVLESFTEYPELVRMLNRLEAGFELSAAVKVHLCCRINREYGLALDPLDAAFMTGAKAWLPAAFRSGDPAGVAAALLSLDS